MRTQLCQQLKMNSENEAQIEVAENTIRSTTPDIFKSESDVSFQCSVFFVYCVYSFDYVNKC